MILLQPHPITFLPPEVMAEIFLSACPPWHLDEEHKPVNPGLAPLFLGSICKSWRDVAWSTPTLWCSFIFTYATTSIPNELQKELLVEWITRAKGGLLSVAMNVEYIDDDDDDDGYDDEFLNAILEVLVAHSTQWRVASLDIPSAASMEHILSRVEHRIPNLISLSLKPVFNFRLNMSMFQDAPLLRELSITLFYLADFNLDWTQLTTLHVDLECAECLEALRRCSESLIHCSMECISNLPDPGVHLFELTPVVAIHLTTLEVTDKHFGNGCADAFYLILPFMTLPALRQLSLPLENVNRIDNINAMLSRSSFPALEVLALTFLHCFIPGHNGERKVLDLLAAIPSLTKICLTAKGRIFRVTHFLTDSFIDMLHPLYRIRDHAFPVVTLPNLRVLEYEGPLSFNVASLADMLSYRWRRPQTFLDDGHGHMSQLKSVKITALRSGFYLSEDNVRAFKNLANEGMDLSWIQEGTV